MSLDLAIRLTEILLGLAFIQQSIEHLSATREEQVLFFPRLVLSVFLVIGFQTQWASLLLVLLGLFILKRFQGPYNGGSDRMSLLILCSLCLALFMPTRQGQELVFGYLALQLVLSYFVSGWVKITNPDWRSGQALCDVLRYSAYPASESFRPLADHSRLIWMMSWAVMLFELFFPLTLITQPTLIMGLILAATFHFVNACLFGLNRFIWIWLAAYPSILWLQDRIFGTF